MRIRSQSKASTGEGPSRGTVDGGLDDLQAAWLVLCSPRLELAA
jgi:hypothetical protein